MKPTRREIVSWCLFDFANSAFTTIIVTVVFSVYFTKIICGGEAAADTWWGSGLLISQLVVVFTAPWWGAWADVRAWKKRFLFGSYLICIGTTALLGWMEPGMVGWALALFIVANIAFSLGENFCASFLPELATPQTMGKISGYGWSLGYVGGLCSLLLCFPLLQGGFTLENKTALQQTSLVTALFFGVSAIPTFLFLRERAQPQSGAVGSALSMARQRVWETLRQLPHEPILRAYFLAFFTYTCGIATVISFAAIYAEREIGLTGTELITFFLVMQISSSVGAFIFGFVQDRFGSVRTLQITLLLWTVVVVAAFFVRDKTVFYVVGNIAGLAIGSSQSASRALMGLLAPEGRRAEYFGLWSMMGKLAAGVGPLTFGLVSTVTGSARWALLSTILYFAVGFLLLSFMSKISSFEKTRDEIF